MAINQNNIKTQRRIFQYKTFSFFEFEIAELFDDIGSAALDEEVEEDQEADTKEADVTNS